MIIHISETKTCENGKDCLSTNSSKIFRCVMIHPIFYQHVCISFSICRGKFILSFPGKIDSNRLYSMHLYTLVDQLQWFGRNLASWVLQHRVRPSVHTNIRLASHFQSCAQRNPEVVTRHSSSLSA